MVMLSHWGKNTWHAQKARQDQVITAGMTE